jgi:DNA polymerase elongation subunit (family B)
MVIKRIKEIKMEKYYKKNYKKMSDKVRDDVEFQIIEWVAQDEPSSESDTETEESGAEAACDERYTIRCFGVTQEGVSVTCKITDFTPFFYIKVSDDFNKVKLQRVLNFVEESWQLQKKVDETWVKYYSSCLLKDRCAIVSKRDIYGFNNGTQYKFIRLVFNNYTALNKTKYIFKKAVSIPGINKDPIKYKLYESNFEPFMRFCHIKEILTAGWVRLPKGKYQLTHDEATTQIEAEINWKMIEPIKDRQTMGNFLQASWDIETYSYDGSFPDPKLQNKRATSSDIEDLFPNVIYQIATTFKYYNESKTLVKHLLTLKKCAKIDDPDVVVQECKTEKELLLAWIKLISRMDPDIMYTYNGDTFDCMYLYERAKLYGIEPTLKRDLSRSKITEVAVKKETFSSSAYGDSDFLRFYIPGRLNYDLLIHYKRGMKKYPSYKLDYIANEILKEGKHEVSAKEIFSYYREGRPEQIKCIGEYCIQDTELLQKLVDRQLILITIIQLANVTYVPIGFLTTKGQTIKVFSQVLRKARQMDYLVPHTNFNEDNYPINIKSKNEIEFDDGDIGEYVEIDCGRTQGDAKSLKIVGKISEIVDETEFIILTDTEITHDYFNLKYKVLFGKNKNREYPLTRLYSSDDLVDDSFTGATVLSATPGVHMDNISVLDFASLYPTVEISRNLCYSTLVMDPKYLNLPGVKYETIEWDDTIDYRLKHTCTGVGKSGKSKGQVCGKQAFFEIKNSLTDTFDYYCRIHDPLKKTRESSEKFQKRDVHYSYTIVQPSKNDAGEIINKGVVPALLEELYSERKKVKKLMAKAAEENNKELEDILNSTQLAIKVSLNSTYGFLSRNRGNLICKPLGQLTTAVGRMLIVQSKEYAENVFCDYVKEHGLLKQKITPKKLELSAKEKEIVLKQFRCK